ncbi:MAG: GntR family transcriptional regulator [Deltaproteobacteria bacterium]|nr:GntR family transcriptional regulator [Deltaproteobacteria bacterium]
MSTNRSKKGKAKAGGGKAAAIRTSAAEKAPSNRRKGESPVDIAFRKIKEMLYHHEIVPGQKLLYQELARKLDMGITPVIQALNRLQLLNIVYSEPNKGYYVGETDPREAKELFSALEALDAFLIPSVVRHMNRKRLDAIENAVKEYVEAASVPEYRRLLMIKDTNFHLKIIECAENKVIYNLCRNIYEQIYLKYRPEYMRDDRLKEAADEHDMILEALKNKDEKRAAKLLRQHIRNARDHIAGGLWRDENFEIDV